MQKQPHAASCYRDYILSFLLPIAILGTAFALHKVYPFGGRQILILDYWYQYFPFLSSFWHKLREGTVSTWSWTAGAGHDYTALIAYYLVSPLNIFAFVLPHEWLRETLTIILLIKIGCAGLFTAVFFRHSFRGNSTGTMIFSSLYALCAFTMGYFWNIMWFDSFALLPLVMTGFIAFMRKDKYRLYVVSLALAVFVNFYIGFFICVFIALAFFSLCIMEKQGLREFLSKLGKITGLSFLAVGMTAVLILPAYIALQSTYSGGTKLVFIPSFYHSFLDILGNFIAFTPPTFIDTDSLPNLYCGMISVLYAGVYLSSPKISLREKITLCGILVFYIMGTNLNILDYAMHGFHFTNGLPSRFSFLISFILVIMAYRAYLLIDELKKRYLIAITTSAFLFLLAAFLGSQKNKYVIGSAVLCTIYLIVLFMLMKAKTAKWRKTFYTIFFLVVIAELSTTLWIAVEAAELTERREYPDRYNEIQALLRQRRIADNDFYRTEVIPFYTVNDSSLYNYNGISFFSSTININLARFIQGIGLIGGGTANNTIGYNLTSPLTNAFLAMRYMIAIGGIPPDAGIYWGVTGQAGDALLLENIYSLPLGFMVNEKITGYAHHDYNSFLSQNDLFQKATGINGNLFIATNYSDNRETVSLQYEVPQDGMLYANFTYFDHGTNKDDKITIFLNGAIYREIYVIRNMPCVTVIGYFSQSDIISFVSDNGTLINTGLFDAEVFKQGYALLADEPLELTHFSETCVRGTVTALADGILYTSIPGKNWNVHVDGKKSELLLIDNAMAAVRIGKGTHNVEFYYNNNSFTVGIIISLVSLAVFIILIIHDRRKRSL